MKSIQHFFNVQAFHPRFPKGQPSRAQSLHGSDLHLRGRLEDLHEAWRVAMEALAELAAVGATEGLTVRKILGASMGGKSKTSMSQKKVKWRFPKIGVPPVLILILKVFSTINQPFSEFPHFMETPKWSWFIEFKSCSNATFLFPTLDPTFVQLNVLNNLLHSIGFFDTISVARRLRLSPPVPAPPIVRHPVANWVVLLRALVSPWLTCHDT